MTETGTTAPLKPFRITVRLTEAELHALRGEAKERKVTVGAALRQLIQELRSGKPRTP
jgi:hypothetical protein